MIVVMGITGYTGRMGHALQDVCNNHPNTCLMGGVTRSHMVPKIKKDDDLIVTDNPEELFPKCDVILDFSHPSVTPLYARLAGRASKAFLTGTTGLNQAALDLLKDVAKDVPVLQTNNVSLSLAVTRHITALAAALLKDENFDIAILDKYHKWKKDAPSGTALTLGEAAMVGNARKVKPTYSSIRTGSIIGEHDILFAGKGEQIKITHSICDRRVFARSAISAALWLTEQPAGFYCMDDMLRILD